MFLKEIFTKNLGKKVFSDIQNPFPAPHHKPHRYVFENIKLLMEEKLQKKNIVIILRKIYPKKEFPLFKDDESFKLFKLPFGDRV